MRRSTRSAGRSRAFRRPTPTICRNRRWPATGSTPWACCRRPISPMAPGLQNTSLSARDRYDPNAPGCAMFFNCERSSLPAGQQRNAIRAARRPRASLQQRVLGVRPRRARVPYSDRRRARCVRTGLRAAPSSLRSPADFRLKTQTSHDIEGGFRIKSRRLPDAIEHLQHGPRERDPFQSRRCSTTSTSIRPAATARRPAPRCASATA